jgi:hypothetical protein
MKKFSPWALNAMAQFKTGTSLLFDQILGSFSLRLFSTEDSIWLSAGLTGYDPLYFRVCFAGQGQLSNIKIKKSTGQLVISSHSVIGNFTTHISWSDSNPLGFQYSCKLKVEQPLTIPFWPRDILTEATTYSSEKEMGEIHHRQEGTRSGLLFMSIPEKKIRMLYLQNLSALSLYADQTGTSLGNTVGGELPEVGFALPVSPVQPLKQGSEVILCDAIIILKPHNPKDSLSNDYLDMLAQAYRLLPSTPTAYLHWPDMLKKGLKDLIDSPGCWSQLDGNHYFNAYVCDYETPPEIMVQLAVLLPLEDYLKWSGEKLEIIDSIKKGLPAFYDKKLGTIVRWHPAAQSDLKGEEEQKKPLVMDSWYLHHPLINLSRLALKGDKAAEKLFLDSIGFAIKVAKKFKYDWPVFYKMDTLEIIKAETRPGEGGERDVPGLYAHVMLQAYELTKDKKYISEAERSARKLIKKGFKLMYQANNTAFSAGALLRLFKITGKEEYLQLSYTLLASIFQNVQLWDCNYGFGKNFPTFFALFPLTDAPYTAVYEEQEVFCALHDYLYHAEQIEILPSVRLLCTEYIRHLVNRAAYYYPPMLPKEMLPEEVKIGELDPNLWIALEDLHDGIEPSGSVGQEVYGAGNAFGILPRHYITIDKQPFLVFCDIPIADIRRKKNGLSFNLLGSKGLLARIRIVPANDEKLSKKMIFKLKDGELKHAADRKTDLETFVDAASHVEITWK